MATVLGTFYSSNPKYLEGHTEVKIDLLTDGVLLINSSEDNYIKKPDISIQLGDDISNARNFSKFAKKVLEDLRGYGESIVGVEVITEDEDGDEDAIYITFYIASHSMEGGNVEDRPTSISTNSSKMEKEIIETIELGIEDLYDELANDDFQDLDGHVEFEIPMLTDGVLVVNSMRDDYIKRADISMQLGDRILNARRFSNIVHNTLQDLSTYGESQVSVEFTSEYEKEFDETTTYITFTLQTYKLENGKAVDRSTGFNVDSSSIADNMKDAIRTGLDDLYYEIENTDLY